MLAAMAAAVAIATTMAAAMTRAAREPASAVSTAGKAEAVSAAVSDLLDRCNLGTSRDGADCGQHGRGLSHRAEEPEACGGAEG